MSDKPAEKVTLSHEFGRAVHRVHNPPPEGAAVMQPADTVTREPLRWATSPPSVPGHYWCRFDRSKWFIVEVESDAASRLWVVEGVTKLLLRFYGAYEWAGPIPQPEEADRG